MARVGFLVRHGLNEIGRIREATWFVVIRVTVLGD